MCCAMLKSCTATNFFTEETMSKSTKNQLIKVKYIPSVPRDEIETRSNFCLPVSVISRLRSAFVMIASEVVHKVNSSHNLEYLATHLCK